MDDARQIKFPVCGLLGLLATCPASEYVGRGVGIESKQDLLYTGYSETRNKQVHDKQLSFQLHRKNGDSHE